MKQGVAITFFILRMETCNGTTLIDIDTTSSKLLIQKVNVMIVNLKKIRKSDSPSETQFSASKNFS